MVNVLSFPITNDINESIGKVTVLHFDEVPITPVIHGKSINSAILNQKTLLTLGLGPQTPK